ncbi:hypothetical protein PVNG_03815 [Plasmodium vivax North Korean]|uniref:Variable surface protein n=1 Tax=Plasmodium vivax North Korean TaxID=1035514 RepID=A0A0J9TUF6_PLAVI|nr:hypothetical protein PVNG_03815 [Plasmodium vivax North Korean]
MYPFLSNIWNTFKEFNKDVDKNSDIYELYREKINYNPEEKLMHKKICVKIIRNIWSFYKNEYQRLCGSECCRYLNNWIYYVSKKHHLRRFIISLVLEVSNDKYFGPNPPISCIDYKYEENYKEPEKIIKLLNFQDNISIIKNTLLNENISMNCACQNYIYECINIYNELDRKYCSKPKEKSGVNKSVCEILDTFKTSYTNDLYNKEGIKEKTPSISSYVNSNNIVGCQEHIKKATVLSNKDENTGSSISRSVPTAVVTMIGVSSFLSLIYKVNITCT